MNYATSFNNNTINYYSWNTKLLFSQDCKLVKMTALVGNGSSCQHWSAEVGRS